MDERIAVGEVELRVRHGGDGPAVLLVHGHPRTGSTWHAVAPRLVGAGFRVIVPDIRGYGRSTKVPVRSDHSQQSKRAVANDLHRLMEYLGEATYAVAGHDRGCYIAMRLALDHPQAVSHVVLMDGIPITEALARCDEDFARSWYHWFFFAVPDKPERAINADPLAWYTHDPDRMGAENHAEWVEAVTNPETVRAMLEDYRAGLTVDAEMERQDRQAGRRITCPALHLWSSKDDLQRQHGDTVAIWREWCTDVRGLSIKAGHHQAEENPIAPSEALIGFLAQSDSTPNGWGAVEHPDRRSAPWTVGASGAKPVVIPEIRHRPSPRLCYPQDKRGLRCLGTCRHSARTMLRLVLDAWSRPRSRPLFVVRTTELAEFLEGFVSMDEATQEVAGDRGRSAPERQFIGG